MTGPLFVLTAEFHGIWESLVYDSGVKTQVKYLWQQLRVEEKIIT